MEFFEQKIKPIILILGSHYGGNEYIKYLAKRLLEGDIKLKTEQIDSKIDELGINFLKSAGFSLFNNSQDEDFESLPYGWEFSIQAANFKTELNKILKDCFNSSDVNVFCDPEICILLSLWREALSINKFDPLILLSVRNPKEVIACLTKKYKINYKKALYLWVSYNLAAIKNSEGYIKGVISYDNWQNPDKRKAQLHFIARLLKINNINIHDVGTITYSILDIARKKSLEINNEEFLESITIPEWAQNLYQKLLNLSIRTLTHEDFRDILTEFEYREVMLRCDKEEFRRKKDDKGNICIVSSEIEGVTQHNSDAGFFYENLSKILADYGYKVTILYLPSVIDEKNSFEYRQSCYAKFGIALQRPSPILTKLVNANYLKVKQSFIAYFWLKYRMFDIVYFSDSGGCSYHTLLANYQGEFAQSTFCLNLISPTEWALEANERFPTLEDSVSVFMEKESYLMTDYIISPSKYLVNWIKLKGINTTNNIFELGLPVTEGIKPINYENLEIDIEKIKQSWIDFNENLLALRFSNSNTDNSIFNDEEEWPLISICIPTHNRINLLSQALASVEHLDYPNYEVIVVDDGSDDPEAIKYLNKIEPLISEKGWKLIRQANKYECAARNTGAGNSSGDWLLFMDDDNIALPFELKKFYLAAEKTGSDIVACNIQKFFGDDYPTAWRQPDEFIALLGSAGELGLYSNVLSDTNALISRRAFEKIGGFTEEYKLSNGDWEFFAKAYLGGFKMTLTPTPLFWYRVSQFGVNTVTNQYKNLRRVFRAYEAFLPDKLKGWPLQIYGVYQDIYNRNEFKNFETQIFWNQSGKFNEEHSYKVMVKHNMYQEFLISIYLPVSNNKDCYKIIRWDPADRPILFNCTRVEVCDISGETLWQWDFKELLGQNQVSLIKGDKGCQILCTGQDPQLIFLMPENAIKASEKSGLIFRAKLMALLNSY
ncbi:MAG: glycosyltransferase [Deltaproteobacteria bacterium]|nr:glycosyltransferase [Deltaproteobacteria bacterium]